MSRKSNLKKRVVKRTLEILRNHDLIVESIVTFYHNKRNLKYNNISGRAYETSKNFDDFIFHHYDETDNGMILFCENLFNPQRDRFYLTRDNYDLNKDVKARFDDIFNAEYQLLYKLL